MRVFHVRSPNGVERTLGRRCAARATGWAAVRLERELARAARLAELEERRAVVVGLYPQLTDAAYPSDDAAVLATATGEDAWWAGRRPRPGMDATWQDYLDRMFGRFAPDGR